MRDNVQISYDPDADITEEDAMRVDGALARLTSAHSDRGRAVWEYYRHQGMDYRRLGQRMGISKDKAGQLVMQGAMWIDGHLSGDPEAFSDDSRDRLIAWCVA